MKTLLAIAAWFAILALGHASARAQADDEAGRAQTPETFIVGLDAGLGLGTRSFVRPVSEGASAQQLAVTPFVAADVALHALRCATDCARAHYALHALLRYQTSIGMMVQSEPLFALPSDSAARSSRLELSLGPRFRLGQSARSPSLNLPIGVSMRALHAAHRTSPIPSYLLLGPHVRAELLAPLAGWLTLSAGPELQWIVLMGERLQNDGARGSGVALGFESRLHAELSEHFGLELSYREAHAFAEGRAGYPDFKDVERFATLRLTGRL